MANKTEYLAALLAKTYIQEVGVEVLLSDYNTEIKTKIYSVRLLEKQSTDRAIPVSHKFAVYREGISGETAFDLDGRYVPYFKENDVKFSAITDYLDGLSNVVGYRVNDYNREQEWGKCVIFLFVTDHIEEKYYFVYNDSGITHKEITTVI